jgi:general nucleoside transport system permease protein
MLEATLAPVATPSRRRRGKLVLEIRQDASLVWRAAILSSAVVFGLLISAAILILAGVPAASLLKEFVVETLLDPQSLRSVLFVAGPFTIVGLAASIAFRAGFWNFGLEGQMIWGAIAATYISMHHVGAESVRLPLMLVAAMTAGVAWIMIAAFLKMRCGVNEIISTLLLGYIASYFLVYLLYGPWLDPRDGFPHSPPFAASERLPELPGDISSAVPLAILAVCFVGWFVHLSRAGLYLRFIQDNDLAALAVGVPIGVVSFLAIGMSGALAALAGAVIVTGQEGRLTYSFYSGDGFSGILIAFLSSNRPFAVVCVATLVAMLFVDGQSLQVFYQIPGSMVQVIEAVIVFCVAAAEFFLRHRMRWIR